MLEARLIVDCSDAGAGAAQLGELAEWLRFERELRGRVRLERAEIPSDRMGGLPEALVVALSSGGAVAVLAQAAVEWVRHRTSDVTLKVVRASGDSFEVSVQRASSPDALVTDLVTFLQQEQQGAVLDETS
ncbi:MULTISPECIES: hypothetical protein [unclassified Streptomyces]|uniref:effector-associated constant component EACC1 n=1 Tax=unclassified Streptomyces TaxID=2593676 RepID=UPI003807F584